MNDIQKKAIDIWYKVFLKKKTEIPMSDEDDAETVAYSDSDRLDAELRQLTWTFFLIVVGFFVFVCSGCYIFIMFLKGG